MYVWLAAAEQRGLTGAVRLSLDVLEPFGPLGAQMVWVLQPALGLLVGHTLLRDVARALETPERLAALREALEARDKSR